MINTPTSFLKIINISDKILKKVANYFAEVTLLGLVLGRQHLSQTANFFHSNCHPLFDLQTSFWTFFHFRCEGLKDDVNKLSRGHRGVVLFTKRQTWKCSPMFANLNARCCNVNTFLKSISTSKSRVTYDLDTNRVTYDLDTDTNTTTQKIIGVEGNPSTSLRLYLPPFRNLIFHCSWKRIHVIRPCPDTENRVFFL